MKKNVTKKNTTNYSAMDTCRQKEKKTTTHDVFSEDYQSSVYMICKMKINPNYHLDIEHLHRLSGLVPEFYKTCISTFQRLSAFFKILSVFRDLQQ